MHQAIEEGETVSEVIIGCVAELTDQDPEEMPPFVESIDTDAIEAFFSYTNGSGPSKLTVVYEGCRVTVERDVVTVREIPKASST